MKFMYTCQTLKKQTLSEYNIKKTGNLVLDSGCLSYKKKQKHIKTFTNNYPWKQNTWSSSPKPLANFIVKDAKYNWNKIFFRMKDLKLFG